VRESCRLAVYNWQRARRPKLRWKRFSRTLRCCFAPQSHLLAGDVCLFSLWQALVELQVVSQREKAQLERVLQDMTSQRNALQCQLEQTLRDHGTECEGLRQEISTLKQQVSQLLSDRNSGIAGVFQRSCADLQRVAALYRHRRDLCDCCHRSAPAVTV
jgi:uncharacterized protein YlxW (UPF0749 family)